MGEGEPSALSIEQLAERAGVSVRTVRYYISQGLLPGPGARGKSASYGDDHLARLRLIRRLVEQHVPLAEQRARLAQLSPDDLRGLLRDEERHSRALDQARTAASPRDYVAQLLARARVAPPAASSTSAAPVPMPSSAPAPKVAPGAAPRLLQVEPRASHAQPQHLQRWELAPGIDLYAEAEAARRHAPLIERLLQTAREELGQQSADDKRTSNNPGEGH